MLNRIAAGRTDLIFDYLAQGNPATATDANGVSLIKWCDYYGDLSAMRFLLAHGERLESLGPNFGLNRAAFHGHWRLCEFFLEHDADPNYADPATGETPLHSALCSATRSAAAGRVVQVLLAHGADPNKKTLPAKATGCFMRDSRTRAETPLHRAAAFADEETIQRLLDAGAALDAKDMNGDSPLTWASWYQRPTPILRKLCYGEFRINPERSSMEQYLLGGPVA